MQKEKIHHLYRLHKSGQLSVYEQQQWNTLLADPAQDLILKEVIGGDWDKPNLQDLKSIPESNATRILNEIVLYPQFKSQKRIYWMRGVAASAVAAILVFAFILINPFKSSRIIPGGNRATLTLADGQTIELRTDQSGIMIDGDGILYNDGSAIIENATLGFDQESASATSMLTLTTPHGGQYQITLPDGTKVWLNAGSALKYPSRFSGSERRVELDGEAYFEVVTQTQSGAGTSFIVKSRNQEVTVLGTQFMVSAYLNESEIKTTLVEGSVEVTSNDRQMLLMPNQQSILKDGVLKQISVNAGEELAWVHGEFHFNDESLESILRKLARWYQIEYVFENDQLKSEAFFGVVSRFDDISKVLNKLEAIGDVKFELVGKTVYIRRK